MLRSRVMAVLRPDRPLSSRQGLVNKCALLTSASIGIALGLEGARECAAITSAYLADYNYASTFVIAIALSMLGLPLLIYWRTRWLGGGLIAAGILSYAMFYGGMAVLLKEDRVAWRHERMISFGPDQKASAVIYFRNGTTGQQVEDFNLSVLMGPALPRHEGRDYPAFVSSYFRLTPMQANGHEGIALNFFNNAPVDEVNAYLATIKVDTRVETVFLGTAPNSIHAESDHP